MRDDALLAHPESFPVTPRMNFRIVSTWPPRGFVIGFANPRVSLHHSCAACVIVAAPGVIKSAIPAGIFAVYVPVMLVQAFAWTYRGHKRDTCASVVNAVIPNLLCESMICRIWVMQCTKQDKKMMCINTFRIKKSIIKG